MIKFALVPFPQTNFYAEVLANQAFECLSVVIGIRTSTTTLRTVVIWINNLRAYLADESRSRGCGHSERGHGNEHDIDILDRAQVRPGAAVAGAQDTLAADSCDVGVIDPFRMIAIRAANRLN